MGECCRLLLLSTLSLLLCLPMCYGKCSISTDETPRTSGKRGVTEHTARAGAGATKSTIRTTKSFTLCRLHPPLATLCPHAFGISSTYICQLHWWIRIEIQIQIRIRVLYANNWTWTVQHAAICGNRPQPLIGQLKRKIELMAQISLVGVLRDCEKG